MAALRALRIVWCIYILSVSATAAVLAAVLLALGFAHRDAWLGALAAIEAVIAVGIAVCVAEIR